MKKIQQESTEVTNIVRREYDGVYTRLREIFDIPDDEHILNFEWDKIAGLLVLTTKKD